MIDCIVFDPVFKALFQLHRGRQCTYPCFPEVSVNSTPHNVLSQQLAAFPHNHHRTMVSNERGMHLVAMTIISVRKEMCRTGDRTRNFLLSSPVRYPLNYAGKATNPLNEQQMRNKRQNIQDISENVSQ